jgi:hypothetical protein
MALVCSKNFNASSVIVVEAPKTKIEVLQPVENTG